MTKIQEEIWKPIPEWEDLYEVSTIGNVRVIKLIYKSYNDNNPTIKYISKKLTLNDRGYPHTSFSRHGFSKSVYVHRLVADTWLPNPDNLPQVNHIDGNKQNNNIHNLEWVTCSENMIHCTRVLKRGYTTKRRVEDEDAIAMRILYKEGMRIKDISRKYNNEPWKNVWEIVSYNTYRDLP